MNKIAVFFLFLIPVLASAKPEKAVKKIVAERNPASQVKSDICSQRADDIANTIYRLNLSEQTKNVQLELIEMIHAQGACETVGAPSSDGRGS